MAEAAEEECYLVNKETGSRFRLNGFIPSREGSDLPRFGQSRKVANAQLPPAVDLRQFMTPVENQRTLNSCVANALAGAYEFLIMKNTGKHIDVSRLFIYYNSRRKDGQQENFMKDSGTYIRNGIEALKEYGCCKEDQYPYRENVVNKRPPQQCYQQAARFRIQDGMQVATDNNEMRACLAEGYPFAFGIQTFSSFHQAEKNGGLVPIPNAFDSQNQQHGWHAMLAVGYTDQQRCFIVRNSWGENWGDQGYCYIPYEYMCDPKRCLDSHAIKLISSDPVPDNSRDLTPNPYDWNTHKNISFFVPNNYHYHYFNPTWFWKYNISKPFFSQYLPREATAAAAATGSIEVVKKRATTVSREDDRSKKVVVLWIDENTSENAELSRHFLTDSNVQVKFVGTVAAAEETIRHYQLSSKRLIIITRGYYKNENKNPLNVLSFLDHYQMVTVPVVVFTGDKKNLLRHLEEGAATMRVYNWKERLQIFSSSEEFVNRIKYIIRQ